MIGANYVEFDAKFSELNNLISVKKLTAENFELLPCE